MSIIVGGYPHCHFRFNITVQYFQKNHRRRNVGVRNSLSFYSPINTPDNLSIRPFSHNERDFHPNGFRGFVRIGGTTIPKTRIRVNLVNKIIPRGRKRTIAAYVEFQQTAIFIPFHVGLNLNNQSSEKCTYNAPIIWPMCISQNDWLR
jgi:hypothetical protein